MTINTIILLNILLAADFTQQVSVTHSEFEFSPDAEELKPAAKWVEIKPENDWEEDLPSSEPREYTHKFPQTNKLDSGLPLFRQPLEDQTPEVDATVKQVLYNIYQYLDRNEDAPENVQSNLILCKDPGCENRFFYPIEHLDMGNDALADGVVPVEFQKKAYEINRRVNKFDNQVDNSTAPAPTTTQELTKTDKPAKSKGLMHALVSKFKKLIAYKKSADGYNKKTQ